MFNRSCLYEKPLIEKRNDFRGTPDNFSEMWSSQFWFCLENDFVEKIVAMRVFSYQDRIAFKLLSRDSKVYTSIILREPELRILKRIWDCGHKDFNNGIKEYFAHSSNAFTQWVKKTEQNRGCFDWYMQMIGR